MGPEGGPKGVQMGSRWGPKGGPVGGPDWGATFLIDPCCTADTKFHLQRFEKLACAFAVTDTWL